MEGIAYMQGTNMKRNRFGGDSLFKASEMYCTVHVQYMIFFSQKFSQNYFLEPFLSDLLISYVVMHFFVECMVFSNVNFFSRLPFP